MSIPRMRTIPECVAMLKELDPETAITITALRNMVKRGKIPAVPVGVGKRQLINFDMLLEMFALISPLPLRQATSTGKSDPLARTYIGSDNVY